MIKKIRMICSLVITLLVAVLGLILLNNNFRLFSQRFQFRTVVSGSMAPMYPIGSLLIVQMETAAEVLQIGDVITYEIAEEVVTHGIVDKKSRDGQYYFVTKGETNQFVDQEEVNEDRIQGKVTYAVPKIGTFFQIIQTTSGKRALLLTLINIILLDSFFVTLSQKNEALTTENKIS